MPGLADKGKWSMMGFRVGTKKKRTNIPVMSTSISIFDNDGNEIGFIQSLNRTHSRPNQAIRHLSALDGGRIIAWAPQVETISLDINGFNLYRPDLTKDGSLLNRMTGRTPKEWPNDSGNPFVALTQQRIPFNIYKREVHPNIPDLGMVTMFGDCMINNWSDPVAIGQIIQAQSVKLDCAWVRGWFLSEDDSPLDATWVESLTIDGMGVAEVTT